MKERLDILKELLDLGFVSTDETGEIKNKDKIVLLHIYESKLKGKDAAFDESLQKKLEKNVSISADEFKENVLAAHNILGAKKQQQLGQGEKLGMGKSFDNLQEEVIEAKRRFKLAKDNYDDFALYMQDEDSLNELFKKGGIKDTEAAKKVMLKKFDEVEKQYVGLQVEQLNRAVDYLVWFDVRAGGFSKPQLVQERA